MKSKQSQIETGSSDRGKRSGGIVPTAWNERSRVDKLCRKIDRREGSPEEAGSD